MAVPQDSTFTAAGVANVHENISADKALVGGGSLYHPGVNESQDLLHSSMDQNSSAKKLDDRD